MIFLFFGTDTVRVRTEAFIFVHMHATDDASVIRLSPNEYVEGMITDTAESSSLFGGTQTVVIDTFSERADVYASLCASADAMRESPHHFVIIEGALTAAEKKRWERYAESMTEYAEVKKEGFNTFACSDALLRRDKKALWLLLAEAGRNGVGSEEIIGVLFWQIKILRLAAHTKSAEEAGQKPFVYQKAKRALAAFKDGELDALSRSLLTVYHDGHAGKGDTALLLERWVLQL